MSKKWILTILGILVLIASGLWYAVDHYVHLPEHITAMETIILGQSRYVPGSQAALRVVVRDLNSQSPIPNATVDVSLQPISGGETIKLYSGSTDDMGIADVSFQVPQDIDPAQQLIVLSSSDLGKDHLEQPINVNREYKILLSTDKPLYQPGQVIHLRALALSTFDLVPAAGQTIEFTIADGKGNKVFRQSTDTSAYGITAVDFQLASEVNTGPYKITAQMGNTSSEKTVTVERYVLPKFNLTWSTERSFYQPGSQVKGTLSAEYFFGKKVTNSEIIIEGFTFDFERQTVFTLTGQTDENGDFDFTFSLPDYLAGSDLEGGIARFYMQATVTDQAQHSEQSSFSLPVTQNQLIIQAIPESGQIRANVDNILYVITSYPDGAPAKTSLQVFIDGQQANQVETGDYGLAEVHFIPQSPYLDLRITARDVQGASAEQSFYFEGDWQDETVLLRPDHAVYQVGDTMQLEMLTSTPSGWVYLDIVREGQTMSTRSVEINDGHGNASVDLDSDLFGTLELHAYKILSSGIIVRDTRLVVVDSPSNLALAITPDKDEYRPGELSNIAFQIAGNDGTGAQAALGLAIVDESVFALAQQDPGFAKLYFMLEAELLQPKYDIHGFSVPDLLGTVPQEPGLQTAMEGAAQASLADAASAVSPFSLQLNSHDEKVELAYERQTAFFDVLAKVLYGILLLISLTIISLVIISAIRMKALASSIALFFGFLLVLVLAIFLIPMPEWIGNQPLERLGYIIENLFINADIAIILIPLAGLVSFIGLAVYAFRARDWNLGLTQILTFAFIPLLILLLFTAGRSALNTGNSVLIFLLIAFLLPPLAFLLRSMMFGVKRQIGWAVASFAVCMLMFMFPFALMASGPVSRGFGARMGALDGIANEAWDQGIMLEEAGIALPMMGPPDAHALKGGEDEETSASSEAPAPGEPPRLRQYFPETMYWQPEAITDENGYLNLEIPMADSITTWRLTALASTQDGRLGSATVGLRAFQDFFIDLDLPLALTQNDEISVPVGVFNYLTEAQTVRLVIEPDDWFELLDESEKEITIAANNIDVVYFRIKAKDFGRQPLQVTAYGSKLSDAILKEVTVYPDGKQITFSHSDILTPDGISQAVEIPDAAIPGTQKLLVKIYPGVVSQVVEGLESILRMPYGCFEQTSSSTYPNILVLDYLQTTGQISPETQMTAEDYINIGYQRLTTFEVNGGGFSLFGDAPADTMLTAFAIQEFTDMNKVYAIDTALIQRSADWLLSNQNSDGSWDPGGGYHETTLTMQTDRLPVTSYIVWALADGGFSDDARTQAGLDFVREQLSQVDDPYVLALAANALVAIDSESGQLSSFTESVLDRLAGMAEYDGDAAYWNSGASTFMGSEGQTADIETTALAAYALLRGDSHADLANAAVIFLVRQKDSFGTWYSTQATMLSLKALIETVRSGAENTDAQVIVKLNGGQTHTVAVTPETFDVVQLVSFDDVNPGAQNTVSIQVEGQGSLMYQISGSYYLPWAEIAAIQDTLEPELVTIDVTYDRTELNVDDTINVGVTVTLNQEGRADWALIDLGIPPGFSVKTEDLKALVDRYADVPEDYAFPTVKRYELTGRQIILYIGNLSHQEPMILEYRLQAKFPIVAQTPASNAYDYYNPDVHGEQAPVAIVVNP